MTSNLLAAAAAVGLLSAGIAGAAETRSFEAMTGYSAMAGSGEAGKCRVDVVRTGASGSADITRQTFSDGSCVCTITTGPAANNGPAEATVTDLLRDRECAGAPVAAGDVAAGAAGGGMGGGTVVGILFGIAALGLGAAAGGGGSDSPG